MTSGIGMLGTVYRQSITENLRLPKLLPWVALGFFSFLLGSLWGQFAGSDPLPDRYGNVSYLIVFRVLALAAAILTSTVVSAEVEQKTIVYLLTRPIPRWVLLIGRYLSCVTVVAAVTVFSALMASVGVFGLNFGSNPLLLRDVLAIILGAFAYSGLFLVITLLFNRAMIVCLLFGFGWESSVPNMPGSVYYISIYSHLQAVADHPSTASNRGIALLTGSMNGNAITLQLALLVLFGLIGITVSLAALIFSTFEFVPREDVE